MKVDSEKGGAADSWLCAGFEWTWKELKNCIFYLNLKEFLGIFNSVPTELITLMYQTSKLSFFSGIAVHLQLQFWCPYKDNYKILAEIQSAGMQENGVLTPDLVELWEHVM